jgi:hypothetical protein
MATMVQILLLVFDAKCQTGHRSKIGNPVYRQHWLENHQPCQLASQPSLTHQPTGSANERATRTVLATLYKAVP